MPKPNKNGQKRTTVHTSILDSALHKIRKIADENDRSLNWCLARIIESAVQADLRILLGSGNKV